ncbi:amyloid-beta precursor protein isoform X2 [Hippocampus zosterae]|uniref:amyloid-beta precursor protein isoform X2 n=1 Tax=Hippocampus zosterae TaxID=109293 RepID=UPI00223DA1B0|nr:amyloid-beta precursor protein isoform X2 [Hippocampus zosterae]
MHGKALACHGHMDASQCCMTLCVCFACRNGRLTFVVTLGSFSGCGGVSVLFFVPSWVGNASWLTLHSVCTPFGDTPPPLSSSASCVSLSASGPVTRSQPVAAEQLAAHRAAQDESDQLKTVKVEAKKAPNVVKVGGERRGKVPPLKPAKPRTIRSTKRAHGKAPAEACLVPMEEGTCARFTLRWYFNSHVQACRPFIYSGCGGNDNRFVHLEECEEVCLGKAQGSPLLQTTR